MFAGSWFINTYRCHGFVWPRPLSERIIAELGEGFHPKMAPSELTVKMVSRLTQMLKDVKRFKPPDGACLSPAGEYNLRCNKSNIGGVPATCRVHEARPLSLLFVRCQPYSNDTGHSLACTLYLQPFCDFFA